MDAQNQSVLVLPLPLQQLYHLLDHRHPGFHFCLLVHPEQLLYVSHGLLRRGGFAIDDYEQIYLLTFCAHLGNDDVVELLLIDVAIPAAGLDYLEIIEDLVLELLVLIGIEPSEKIGNAEIDSFLD